MWMARTLAKEITFLPRPLPPPHILCSSTFWNNFYEFFVLSEGEEPGMVRQGPVPGARGKGHGWCLRTSVCDVSVWEQFSYSELLHAFGSFKIWPQGISIQITRTCQKKSRNRQIQVHIDTCSSLLQTKVPRWLHKEKIVFSTNATVAMAYLLSAWKNGEPGPDHTPYKKLTQNKS